MVPIVEGRQFGFFRIVLEAAVLQAGYHVCKRSWKNRDENEFEFVFFMETRAEFWEWRGLVGNF